MRTALLVAFIALALAEQKRFDNDVVIQVIPRNTRQLSLLQRLQDDVELDFWTAPVMGAPTDIRLSQTKLLALQQTLKSAKLQTKMVIDNVQKVVDGVLDKSKFSMNLAPTQRYASYNEIADWLKAAATSCGDRCKLIEIGTTHEGRKLEVIKITAPGSSEDKPAVFVDGGIHAREWISPAFVTNMIEKLIDNTDSSVSDMLARYDFYIIPVLNPDGYQFSHDSDRLWRKNRVPTEKRRCIGVDLNRNFGYQYGVSGVSTNPCSEVYMGTGSFSELESQALRDYLTPLQPKVYLTFHSYGQYFLFPWGYDRVYAPNHDKLMEAGNAGAQAIRNAGGGSWIVGNSAIALYPSAGASDDWAYSIGATYSYTLELPPSDDNIGFLLPESKIETTVTQVWPGVKALMKNIMDNSAVSQLSGDKDGGDQLKQSVMKGNAWWKNALRNEI